jgi:hypothetical protein
MNTSNYKQEVIDAAIAGMVQGGFSLDRAKTLIPLLDRVFDSGYHQCRQQYIDDTKYNTQD